MPPGTLADAELIEHANVEDEPEENAAVESVVGLVVGLLRTISNDPLMRPSYRMKARDYLSRIRGATAP